MRISFIGDLHLGFERKSFTHAGARGRYSEVLLEQAHKAINFEAGYKIQVGDVFHNYNNSDITLMDGLEVCSNVDLVVAGNHDISKTINNKSTLALVDARSNTDFVFPNDLEQVSLDNTSVVVIPYCYTQTDFEAEVQKAYEFSHPADSKYKILVLHTNYDLSFDLTETTNNLTREDAETLLEKYDYIVSGHEHNYNKLSRGRIIMTGSVFPLSTSELEDKYTTIFDTNTGKMETELVWDAKAHTKVYDIKDLPETLPEHTQFVSLVGEASPADLVQGQKQIVKWWKKSSSLLVCKPEYSIATELKKSIKVVTTDMVTSIRDLLDPPTQELLDNILTQIKGSSNDTI